MLLQFPFILAPLDATLRPQLMFVWWNVRHKVHSDDSALRRYRYPRKTPLTGISEIRQYIGDRSDKVRRKEAGGEAAYGCMLLLYFCVNKTLSIQLIVNLIRTFRSLMSLSSHLRT